MLYASYYMCRYNFRFAGPGMSKEFNFDTADLANIWVIWSLAYGTGQLVNGIISDRIGGKWIMLAPGFPNGPTHSTVALLMFPVIRAYSSRQARPLWR